MSNDGPDYKPTPAVGMPAQPKTTELPAVPQWAIELTTSVKTGFQGVHTRLDNVEGNLELQGAQGVDLGKRMTALETRVGGIEERQGRYSGGARELGAEVKSASKANLDQDAAIASIIAEQAEAKKRDAATQALVADNTRKTEEIRAAVLSAFKHPAVQALVFAGIAFLTAWFTRHT